MGACIWLGPGAGAEVCFPRPGWSHTINKPSSIQPPEDAILTTPANSQQQNELTQLYASYSEAELNDLALTAEDLTDSAQQALQAEYNRRGLVQPKLFTPQGVAAQGDGDPLQTFSSNAPTE